jgi:hypothetical protein
MERILVGAAALAAAAAVALAAPGPGLGAHGAPPKHGHRHHRCKKHHKWIRHKCRRVRPGQVSRFGAMITDAGGAARWTRLRELGATRVRLVARLDHLPNGNVSQAEQQGFQVLLTATNTALPSRPPSDLADFQARLGQALTDHPTPVVAIENEEQAQKFYTGTVQDYLSELAAAIPVAHAHGVAISDGGIVSAGVILATWYDLWTSGRQADADHYVQIAIPPSRMPDDVLTDLPSSSDPEKPILSNHPSQLAALDGTLALVAGFRSLPLDYVNFHWYGSPAEALATSVAYLRRATGHEVMTNEIGQFDASPDYVTSLMSEAATLRIPWITWFASDGSGGAVGMFNPDNSLRANGVAYRNFIIRCDDRVDCGKARNKRKKKRHLRHNRH